MIHTICKTYGLSKKEAGKHTEADFWEMLLFENLDAARNCHSRESGNPIVI